MMETVAPIARAFRIRAMPDTLLSWLYYANKLDSASLVSYKLSV